MGVSLDIRQILDILLLILMCCIVLPFVYFHSLSHIISLTYPPHLVNVPRLQLWCRDGLSVRDRLSEELPDFLGQYSDMILASESGEIGSRKCGKCIKSWPNFSSKWQGKTGLVSSTILTIGQWTRWNGFSQEYCRSVISLTLLLVLVLTPKTLAFSESKDSGFLNRTLCY